MRLSGKCSNQWMCGLSIVNHAFSCGFDRCPRLPQDWLFPTLDRYQGVHVSLCLCLSLCVCVQGIVLKIWDFYVISHIILVSGNLHSRKKIRIQILPKFLFILACFWQLSEYSRTCFISDLGRKQAQVPSCETQS